MTEKELIKQLKNLANSEQAGALNKERGNLLCQNLMAKIDEDSRLTPASYLPKLWFLRGFGLRNCFQHAVVTSLVFAVGIGGGLTTVSASLNSLPGDTLYTVKLTTEKVRLALAQDEAMKINLRAEFVGRRIEEMKTIVQSPVENKGDRIELALANIKIGINSVNDSIVNNAVSEDIATGTIKFIDQKIIELSDIIVLNAPELSDKIRGVSEEMNGIMVEKRMTIPNPESRIPNPESEKLEPVATSSIVIPENKEVPEAPKKIQFQIIIEE